MNFIQNLLSRIVRQRKLFAFFVFCYHPNSWEKYLKVILNATAKKLRQTDQKNRKKRKNRKNERTVLGSVFKKTGNFGFFVVFPVKGSSIYDVTCRGEGGGLEILHRR